MWKPVIRCGKRFSSSSKQNRGTMYHTLKIPKSDWATLKRDFRGWLKKWGNTKMKRERLLINVSHLLALIMLFSVFAQGTVQFITTATLTKLGDGGYQATVNVRNNGNGTAEEVVLSTATLGAAAGTPAPQAVGSIPARGRRINGVYIPGKCRRFRCHGG